MKLIGLITTAILSLTIGAAAPVFAQQEQHDQEEQKAKPAPEEKKAQPEKAAKQEAPKAKPTQQEEKKTQPEKSAKQEEKPAAQQQKNAKQDQKSAKQQETNNKQQQQNAKQEKNNKPEQKTAQRQTAQPTQHAGGNSGGRIPADRYQAHFGREHTFRVSQSDYRNRRFQYGGYWFGFNDAWPSNWLYTQDVFVVEIDGVYYLCNASYPGVNVSLNITL
jgi:hypothetical protein